MVYGNTLPQLGGSKEEMTHITLSFGLPRFICHGPKEAASAMRRANASKPRWDFAIQGKILEAGEELVPQTIVPLHQFGLVVGSGDKVLVLLDKRRRGIECEGGTTDSIGMWSRL